MQLVATIPTGTATLYLDVVVALNMDLPSRDEYARVRGILLTGKAKVVLETDLPGLARIETTLGDPRDVPAKLSSAVQLVIGAHRAHVTSVEPVWSEMT